MSCFEACEFCNKLGEKLCKCSSPPRFCCSDHIPDHINLNREVPHYLENALVRLSEESINLLKEAARNYQIEMIRKVNLRRNKIINSLLQRMRRVEHDCSFFIENALSGEMKLTGQMKVVRQVISHRNEMISSLLQEVRRVEQNCSSFIESALNAKMKETVEELVFARSLPVYSSSSFLKSLVFLKKSNAFSLSSITKCILSLFPIDQIYCSQVDSYLKTEEITESNSKLAIKKKKATANLR